MGVVWGDYEMGVSQSGVLGPALFPLYFGAV